jgi:integrase
MERQKAPYSLQKRPTNRKNRFIYYVQFRDENGGYRNALSTGCSNRDDALRWCEEHLKDGDTHVSGMTFGTYAQGFWTSEGAYTQSKLAHGYNLSAGTLYVADCITKKHIIPKWGDSALSCLTPGKIDAWIVQLRREGRLASASINHILQSMRTILQQAFSEGLIKENPAALVRRVKLVQVPRGILNMAEAKMLLASDRVWKDHRHFVLNLLAASTGARMGEIRGLQTTNLFPDHIEIRHSWSDHGGLKEPKWGSARNIPITSKVSGELECLIVETQPTSIVFYGEHSKDRPLGPGAISKELYEAMKRIGITEAERRRRRLSFHGWRHWLNTALRSRGLPDSKLRQITGHSSEAMSDRYTHYDANDFHEVIVLQEEIID